MTKVNEVYQCAICGNVVEVTVAGAGDLVCCGVPMELLVAKTEDDGREKHRPVLESAEKEISVRVGEVDHPMEEGHFIQWIELVFSDRTERVFFKPGDKPRADFFQETNRRLEAVRAYCNIHGLWELKI